MNFRHATADDVPFILNLLREFYRKTGVTAYGIKFDGESAVATICEVLARGVCIVGPTSCAGAVFQPFPWNYRARVAQVVFWYFKSSREIRIFDALMDECRNVGATHINAASHFPKNAINRWYSKYGLKVSEIQSIARL